MIITRKHVFSFIFLAIFSISQLAMLSFTAKPVNADDSLFNSQVGIGQIGSAYGGQKTDLRIIITEFIKLALSFLAIIFVVLILYAGFRYMTAAGNQDQTKKSMAQIRDAVIGLIIVLAAWAITSFILRAIYRSVNGSVQLY